MVYHLAAMDSCRSHELGPDRRYITSNKTTLDTEEIQALRSFAQKMTKASHQHADKATTWMSSPVPLLASALTELRVSYPVADTGLMLIADEHLRISTGAGFAVWSHMPNQALLGGATLSHACLQERQQCFSIHCSMYCTELCIDDIHITPRMEDVSSPLVVCTPIWRFPDQDQHTQLCGEMVPRAILTAHFDTTAVLSKRLLESLEVLSQFLAQPIESSSVPRSPQEREQVGHPEAADPSKGARDKPLKLLSWPQTQHHMLMSCRLRQSCLMGITCQQVGLEFDWLLQRSRKRRAV
eukprot:jgi/Botrbrau1/19583/Bobra.0035s0066.1